MNIPSNVMIREGKQKILYNNNKQIYFIRIKIKQNDIFAWTKII